VSLKEKWDEDLRIGQEKYDELKESMEESYESRIESLKEKWEEDLRVGREKYDRLEENMAETKEAHLAEKLDDSRALGDELRKSQEDALERERDAVRRVKAEYVRAPDANEGAAAVLPSPTRPLPGRAKRRSCCFTEPIPAASWARHPNEGAAAVLPR
jgi:hypothetical protein